MQPLASDANLDPKFTSQMNAVLAFASHEAARIAAMPFTPNSAHLELTFRDQRLADVFGGVGPDNSTSATVERRPFTPPPVGSPALALVA